LERLSVCRSSRTVLLGYVGEVPSSCSSPYRFIILRYLLPPVFTYSWWPCTWLSILSYMSNLFSDHLWYLGVGGGLIPKYCSSNITCEPGTIVLCKDSNNGASSLKQEISWIDLIKHRGRSWSFELDGSLYLPVMNWFCRRTDFCTCNMFTWTIL
jgi:hypothetical protein